ncbi:PREDICTED: CASP [Prunus dulcis]|uniref:CASP-like protein n=1 Tax=Prunus dulcis TaxID=3755 RepID=A0A5E4END1_PRUDU|nr:CASP-like protein 4A3 [Prunus dulcis]VVA16912.1 PREDICTED: CASP [Prunus dulcis]
MEPQSQPQQQNQNQKSKPNMNKSYSMNSDDSPLRFHSPIRSDAGDPPETPPYESPENSPERRVDNSKAIMAVDKFTQYSPLRPQKPPENAKAPSPVVVYNRSMREDMAPSVSKVGPVVGANGGENVVNGVIGGGRSRGITSTRPKRGDMVKTAALGFRVSEVVLCLISFSVMAADKTQGWSGDSFDRYKEYRYCLAVNVIAFAYAAFQAYNLSYHLVTQKYVIRHHLRRHFDFFMDQVLAYLLISASSSAATRVDDWQSNWGKDEFTEMATASVSMAFLAFVAFALSSLISGYNLCTHDSA